MHRKLSRLQCDINVFKDTAEQEEMSLYRCSSHLVHLVGLRLLTLRPIIYCINQFHCVYFLLYSVTSWYAYIYMSLVRVVVMLFLLCPVSVCNVNVSIVAYLSVYPRNSQVLLRFGLHITPCSGLLRNHTESVTNTKWMCCWFFFFVHAECHIYNDTLPRDINDSGSLCARGICVCDYKCHQQFRSRILILSLPQPNCTKLWDFELSLGEKRKGREGREGGEGGGISNEHTPEFNIYKPLALDSSILLLSIWSDSLL